VSRVCEEFPAFTPHAAADALEHDPDRLVLEVITLRDYARIRERLHSAKTDDEMPAGELADLVCENEVRMMREARERRQRVEGD
jgi:hypothetical protein